MQQRSQVVVGLARQWIDKALDDLSAARVLMESGRPLLFAVAFHSQQACEKALKALLTWHQVEFRKTHDLQELLDRLETVEPSVAASSAGAVVLTPFSVEGRYPTDFPPVTRDEARQHLRVAEDVCWTAAAVLSAGPESPAI